MSSSFLTDFTHLRVHSQYSLLRSTASVSDLVKRAVADGLNALALTDTDNLYAAVGFNSDCKRAGLQPITGMTIDVLSPVEKDAITPLHRGQLILLAMDPEGYRSLCRLSSLILGDPRRDPRLGLSLTWAELRDNRGGLICLEGGRRGWLRAFLKAGDLEAGSQYLARLAGVYGENGYLGLEIHPPHDQIITQEVEAMGQRFGLPTVALQPIFCLDSTERSKLNLLTAIHLNTRLEELPDEATPSSGDPTVDLHWLNPSEVAERFSDYPEALERVGEIVRRCEPAIQFEGQIWPSLDLPEGQSPDRILATQAHEGLKEKYDTQVMPSVNDRIERELGAIARYGYSPLFLVVADIVRYARKVDIPVSTRGSVANSLVAFCVGITTVDPIAHDLFFERFLNPARSDLPDIDLDFCSRRRDEVLDYVRRVYGEDRVALVATVSTLQLKSAVRETAKAYGFEEVEIKRLTAKLPRRWHPDPRRRKKHGVDELLAEFDDERSRGVVRAAYDIVGQPDHLSVHPGGVVITPGPLTDVVPVQWAPKGFLITQYDHADLERIGLPKIDLLGIRALTVLADTADLVRRNHDPTFRWDDIPLDDPDTGDLISKGQTIGVFQCESEGAQRTLRQLRARTIRDLAMANAFFKPGPATGGMAKVFVRRYRGEEPVTFQHPALEPILGHTKGVLIFQEQILRLAREIAGLTWEEADHLRRGMSKFQAEEMESMRAKFSVGCQRPYPDGPGLTSGQAEVLWEQVAAFAGYGFNQGHATAYADTSYRSAYLKAHWPAAFLCARLADRGGYHHPAIYMAEARRLGIAVRPPHVNHSGNRFTLMHQADDKGPTSRVLWMGLGQVRDLRRSSVEEILRERELSSFSSVLDLMGRVKLQVRELENLVKCGGFDGLGSNRSAMLAETGRAVQTGNAIQQAFDFSDGQVVPPEAPAQRMEWEQHILGLPVSIHPLELVMENLENFTSLEQVPQTSHRKLVIAGTRLPGWTGGQGFFLGDGKTYINVKLSKTSQYGEVKPEAWKPLRLRGQWCVDPWGSGWFQADGIDDLVKLKGS